MTSLLKNKKGIQLTKIIVGQLLVISVIMGIYLFLNAGINEYVSSPPAEYNESFLRIKGIYGNLSETLNKTNTELGDIDSSTGGVVDTVNDFLGFFFNAGYRAARVAGLSIGGINTMIDVALSEVALGSYGDLLKGLLLLGVIVVFVIGIFLNFIIKSGRE